MAFDNLTVEMQNLVLVNFEFFAKIFLTLVVFGLTASYIFYFSKRFQPTPFILVSLLRGVTYVVSWVVLTSLPLWIFFVNPKVSLDIMLRFLFISYTIFYLVVGILFFINIVYFVPMLVMRYGNFDIDKARTKGFIDKLSMFSEYNYGKKSQSSNRRRYVSRLKEGERTSKTA